MHPLWNVLNSPTSGERDDRAVWNRRRAHPRSTPDTPDAHQAGRPCMFSAPMRPLHSRSSHGRRRTRMRLSARRGRARSWRPPRVPAQDARRRDPECPLSTPVYRPYAQGPPKPSLRSARCQRYLCKSLARVLPKGKRCGTGDQAEDALVGSMPSLIRTTLTGPSQVR